MACANDAKVVLRGAAAGRNTRQRNSRRAALSARGVAARWRSHYRDESPGGRAAAVRSRLALESPRCGVAGRSSCRRAEL